MQKRFVGSLFDLSFTSFVTIRLVKVLYVLSLGALAIAYVAIAIKIFGSSSESISIAADGSFQAESGGNTTFGILWLLVLGPLFVLFYTLFARVMLELVVVLFRIFENTRDQLAVARATSSTHPARERAAIGTTGSAPTP